MRVTHLTACWLALLCLTAQATASAQAPAADLSSRTPVTWLLFIDDLHLDFRNTGRIRTMLRTLSTELILEGDQVAIVSSGPSALAIDLTSDRQVLDAAIKRATGNGLKYEDVQAGNGAEVLYRVSTALATAQSVLERMPRAPSGPKAVLYISNGYNLDALAERAQFSRDRTLTRSGVLAQVAELTTSAAKSTVPVFAIDPRATFTDLDVNASDPAWQTHLAATNNSLRSIAEGSGGFAIVDRDFATQLKRIAATMGR